MNLTFYHSLFIIFWLIIIIVAVRKNILKHGSISNYLKLKKNNVILAVFSIIISVVIMGYYLNAIN